MNKEKLIYFFSIVGLEPSQAVCEQLASNACNKCALSILLCGVDL